MITGNLFQGPERIDNQSNGAVQIANNAPTQVKPADTLQVSEVVDPPTGIVDRRIQGAVTTDFGGD